MVSKVYWTQPYLCYCRPTRLPSETLFPKWTSRCVSKIRFWQMSKPYLVPGLRNFTHCIKRFFLSSRYPKYQMMPTQQSLIHSLHLNLLWLLGEAMQKSLWPRNFHWWWWWKVLANHSWLTSTLWDIQGKRCSEVLCCCLTPHSDPGKVK